MIEKIKKEVLKILDKYEDQELDKTEFVNNFLEANPYKKMWAEQQEMLLNIERQSIEREDRAFIYYDELMEGNKKLEQKYLDEAVFNTSTEE